MIRDVKFDIDGRFKRTFKNTEKTQFAVHSTAQSRDQVFFFLICKTKLLQIRKTCSLYITKDKQESVCKYTNIAEIVSLYV